MPVNSFENYPMSWKPVISDRKGAIYTQLAEQLVKDIRNGLLKPGDKLPPQRELADYLDLHLSTVTRAYKLCEERGLICAKVGQGTFVSSDVNTSDTLLYANEEFNFVQLGTVLPPYNGNQKVIEFIKSLLSQPDIQGFLEYRSPTGTYIQRKNFSIWVQKIGIDTTSENILFATGGQNAICATILGLFHPGDRIGVNALSFSGLKAIAKMIGVQLVPLPEKQGHIDLDTIEQFCETENLKGLYFIPDHHNPTTYTMKSDERKFIANIAVKNNLVIIEDAINRMFVGQNIPPIFSYAPNNTIYIFSTSKFLCAGLRVAYIIVPNQYRQSLENALYNMNLMVSPFNLEIVNRIFSSVLLEELITEKKQELMERNTIVNSILQGYDILGESTCNFRWLFLPDKWNSHDFEIEARKRGVQIFCADRFAIGKTVPPKAIRLSISSPSSRAELENGITIIKSLL